MTPSRLDNNFKFRQLSEVEKEEFIDELFQNLFDEEVNSDCDKVPDLSAA
jgi:hypothetical protein